MSGRVASWVIGIQGRLGQSGIQVARPERLQVAEGSEGCGFLRFGPQKGLPRGSPLGRRYGPILSPSQACGSEALIAFNSAEHWLLDVSSVAMWLWTCFPLLGRNNFCLPLRCEKSLTKNRALLRMAVCHIRPRVLPLAYPSSPLDS